ncbi:MAG: hypothetical protein LAT54_05675, partial [Cryomorphaceae bacterium]|nr:hypothetical protein [Cryomorphaceae bacterium]
VSEILFTDYGVHLLFLLPEYRGETDIYSFWLVGLGLGLFVMAFHVSSYIFYSYRYSFLATLDRPIYRFSVNNSVIPITFIIFYAWQIFRFNRDMQTSNTEVLIYICALLLGVFMMIAFVFAYFFTLNRNKNVYEDRPIQSFNSALQNIYSRKRKTVTPMQRDEGVNTYLRNMYRLRLTRSADHYEYSKLLNALEQHHLRAAYFFIALIAVVFSLGTFEENAWVQIPAAATTLLMLSVFLMLSGAFFSRFKGWTPTAAFVVLVGLNYLSSTDMFYKPNMATGLNYDTIPASYDRSILESLTTDSILWHDHNHWIDILNKWKSKQTSAKPKLIIVNVTGGGIRSSLWTFATLNLLDSVLDGQLHEQTFMITGSSGGMLGASFFREIKYREASDDWNEHWPTNREALRESLAKDKLNPTIFNFLVNDLFLRFRKFEYRGRTYYKDRGTSFDRVFNEHTLGMLDKTLDDYYLLEKNAEIPAMIFAPIMIQDGRRMVMSAQPTSFLTFTQNQQTVLDDRVYDGLEFRRIFADQDAGNISFLTANRISASFPYITPLVNLPSDPEIELIDAGVRDNDGFEIGMRFAHQFNQWLEDNTSGIIFIRIKADRPHDEPQLMRPLRKDRFSDLTRPISGVISSFSNLQVFNKSLIRQFGEDALDVPIDVINFPLFRPWESEGLSLSWRFTPREREKINEAIERKEIKSSVEDVLKKIE